MKVVINTCYGGYGLSRKAVERLIELGSEEAKEYLTDCDQWRKEDEIKYGISIEEDNSYYVFSDDRSNVLLVQVVEELKEEANSRFAQLKIVEIPDNTNWYISDYDGIEAFMRP